MTRLILGDSREVLARLEPNSLDALCCDPPAGISFMGKEWDGAKGGSEHWINWLSEIMFLALQALKPGAHGLVWALPRTSHWTARALELAGFEIRDCVQHVFGSGFPKSLSLPVAIDKSLDAIGDRGAAFSVAGDVSHLQSMEGRAGAEGEHVGITSEAQQWQGWGTALKPAAEFWWLVRKPLAGTVAANVLRHGTGGINVDGCRVGTSKRVPSSLSTEGIHGWSTGSADNDGKDPNVGRWPPHLLLTHSIDCNDRRCVRGCPVEVMDGQSGTSTTAPHGGDGEPLDTRAQGWGFRRMPCDLSDSGGSSRFFPRFHYLPKPSRAEREAGCGHLPGKTGAESVDRDQGTAGLNNPRAGAGRTAGTVHNHHPTLKGLDLMRWLVRLVTPPGGTVLDPFMGSGTTGIACVCEGFDFVGVEQDPDYIQIARARIEHYASARQEIENSDEPRPKARGQQGLF